MLHTLLAARPVPSLADWWTAGAAIAAAVGTVAAVVVALTLAQRDGRRREAEQRVRDAERRDAEAAQARLISYTKPRVSYETVLDPSTGTLPPVPGPVMVSVTVYNDSNLPVWHVSGALDRQHPQGNTSRLAGVEARASRIEPHSFTELQFRGLDGGVEVAHWDGGDRLVFAIAELTFTDAAGLQWRHRPGGAPPERLYEAGGTHRR